MASWLAGRAAATGFGYDPMFVPEATTHLRRDGRRLRSTRISHRADAFGSWWSGVSPDGAD